MRGLLGSPTDSPLLGQPTDSDRHRNEHIACGLNISVVDLAGMFRPHAMCSLLWLLRCRSCNGEPPPDLVHPDDDDALANVQAAKAELARSCNEQMTKLEELEATLLHRGATHSGPRRLQQAGSEHSCPLESLLGLSAGVKQTLRSDTKLWEKAAWAQPYQSEPLAAHPSSKTVLVDMLPSRPRNSTCC